MVGVPGRSKGCNTCRQRRVKCTEEKPICSRCTRGGFTCRGYVRDIVWHHTTAEPSAESSTQVTLGRLVVVERPKPNSKTKGKAEARTAARTQAPAPSLPSQISLAAFQDDLCFAFIFSNFVWRGYGASWLHQSAQGLLGELAFDSVKSLAEINFGKSQKSYQTEIQGRVKYGTVLRRMVERLGDGQKNKLWELIIPILLLLMHNTTLSNQSATLFHLKAMSEILSACGPQMFLHQPLRDAFEAARATLVMGSMLTHKRVFMDDPTWHNGPYTLVPQSKEPQSYLLDILGSVPGFLEEYHKPASLRSTESDVVDDGSEGIAMLQPNIIDRIMAKLESLFVWRLHWQFAFSREVSVESGTQNSSNESPIRPNDPSLDRLGKLHFSRPGAAADIGLYNAVLMWLIALINELQPFKAQSIVQTCAYQAMTSMSHARFTFSSGLAPTLMELPPFEPLSAVGSITRVRNAALEICRVFEWQSMNHASAAWETNFVYMFPIGLALCVFDKEPEIHNWIRAMLGANPLTRDYGFHGAEDGNSVHNTSSMNHPPSVGDADAGMMEDLGPEMGMLRSLQGFGSYVSREMIDDESSRASSNQNLVHLLLLRGRMDVSS
ncbi:hypothetical protein GGR51DRAFT_90790 [Nemania sp. FL0031]|nr:hypothetical protein GGR51DRAFT_90790 [Nemania sp. FL0031]